MMKTLAQLFEEKRGILDNGAYVRSNAKQALEGTSLHFTEALREVPEDNGTIIAVGFYSLPDLELLDVLAAKSRAVKKEFGPPIEVVDVTTFKSMQQFESIIPGITPVYDTPVVGIWEGGELVLKGWGTQGRKIISQYYRVNIK